MPLRRAFDVQRARDLEVVSGVVDLVKPRFVGVAAGRLVADDGLALPAVP